MFHGAMALLLSFLCERTFQNLYPDLLYQINKLRRDHIEDLQGACEVTTKKDDEASAGVIIVTERYSASITYGHCLGNALNMWSMI